MNDLPSNSIDKKYLLPTIIHLHSRGVLAKIEPQWSELIPANTNEDEVRTPLVAKFSKVIGNL